MEAFRLSAGRSRRGSSTSTVLVVAGTRPESIKLAPVVWALDADRALSAVVVNSGQHPAAARTAFEEFGVRLDVELDALPSLSNLLASFDHLRTELRAVIARYRPRCVLVQGDTLTSYAGAAAGRDNGCSVVHVEAGLRTPSAMEPFPEEWFRRRIAQLADIHFAPTQAAVGHLRSEGIPASAIHHSGNTGIDSLRWALDRIESHSREARVRNDRILVTLHRRENHDRNADIVCRALLRLSSLRPELTMVLPVHPNPRVAEPIRRRLGAHPAFELVAPMAYRDFISTAMASDLIISDSGGIQEEAPHLGTPLLVPRCNTERPEAIATGFVRLIAVDEHGIVNAALAALSTERKTPVPIDADAPFGAGDAAQRIVTVLRTLMLERAIA
jgi:UDP-N-acetylglucosamine 2-epimerase (non-hydrolysing)